MSGENFESEKTQLIVDNLVLNGLQSEYVATNAVSKAYVDTKVSDAVSSLVNGASAAVDTLKELNDVLSAAGSSLSVELLSKIGDEKKDREAADLLHMDAISLEVTDRNNEILRVEQAYQSADNLLSGRIDAVSMSIENEAGGSQYC